jgi:hypothetical protein
MEFKVSWKQRLLEYLAAHVPRALAYLCATQFWLYAYRHVTDEQSDHFFEVVQAGYDHWGQEAPPEADDAL